MSHYIRCPQCREETLDSDTLRCSECGYSAPLPAPEPTETREESLLGGSQSPARSQATSAPSLAHLDKTGLLAEFADRFAGYNGKLTMKDIVLCAFWDDYELTEEQYAMLCAHFDNFRPVRS